MIMSSSPTPSFFLFFVCLFLTTWSPNNIMVEARPLVRHIRSTHEFERLLQKHSTETGLPVIVDFYSDGCGPCRMMAPIFKQLAKETGQDKAVFVKVDTNAMYELSSKYQIRSLPTFAFFLGGRKVDQFSGAGEAQLRQMTTQVVRQAEAENVKLTLEDLTSYYQEQDPTKTPEAIDTVYQKCVDMTNKGKGKSKGNQEQECVGAAANQLSRRLKKKYNTKPSTVPRFSSDASSSPKEQESSTNSKTTKSSKSQQQSQSQSPPKATNLHLATKEELLAELEQRQDAEVDAAVESEEDDDAEFQHGWNPQDRGDFPERVTVIGGGPAGLSAAIYAARAGLTPVVVAPPLGGQLQGKGVDVENYPGLVEDITGPGVVSQMRDQAIQFGAVFESETVLEIDVSTTPYQVVTNSSSISTHSIIVATGAESKWLGIPGEYALRGGGVSSCATCDGALYANQHVVVVGGGDTAMEDALVLARTSQKVTLVHRRDTFRASKVLAQRVMEHPSIHIQWNTVVTEIKGRAVDKSGEEGEEEDLDNVDLDNTPPPVVSGVVLQHIETEDVTTLDCQAVFVAIGHTPTTSFLEGIVEFDPDHPGYVHTQGKSTRTSVPGIFAAGDVSDSIYRQAITSAGSGAAAALDAERWLSEEGLGNEAAEFEAELLAELANDNDSAAGSSAHYNVYESAGGRMENMKESVVGGGAEL